MYRIDYRLRGNELFAMETDRLRLSVLKRSCAKQVTDYLKDLKAQGHAIILSTHIFSVAEELCDEIAMLIDGTIVAQGTVNELVAQTQAKNFEEAFFKIYVENHKE